MGIFEKTYNNWPSKYSIFRNNLGIAEMKEKIKELEWKFDFAEKRNDILIISNNELKEKIKELNKINSRYEILDL